MAHGLAAPAKLNKILHFERRFKKLQIKVLLTERLFARQAGGRGKCLFCFVCFCLAKCPKTWLPLGLQQSGKKIDILTNTERGISMWTFWHTQTVINHENEWWKHNNKLVVHINHCWIYIICPCLLVPPTNSTCELRMNCTGFIKQSENVEAFSG